MRRLLSIALACLAVLLLACAPAAVAQDPGAPAPQPAPAAPAAEDGGDDALAPLLVGLAVLLGLAALAVLAWGLARLTSWEPGWLPATRHAVGEAAYRTGSTWAEFRDWVRPRRR